MSDPEPGGVVRRWTVEVSPGCVRLKTTVTGSEESEPTRVPPGGPEQLELELADDDPEDQELEEVEAPEEATRGAITEWSAASRRRMIRRMATLDWTPVLDVREADGPTGPYEWEAHVRSWRPAMITLTLPSPWEDLAPTGTRFKELFRALLKRWRRALGRRWAGIWKLEFQRRGAPHVHLYCAVPVGEVTTRVGRGRGARWETERFSAWLSRTWTAVVFGAVPEHDPECSCRPCKHLRAGTGIDWREGIRASDPKRLSVYFSKRSGLHNLGRSKEYQHRVPEAWQSPGGGPGRFWGYRGLQRAVVEVELDREQWVSLRRLLRRWSVSRGYRVQSLYSGRWSGGWVLANDAPALVAAAARWDALSSGGEPWRRWTRIGRARRLDLETGEVARAA